MHGLACPRSAGGVRGRGASHKLLSVSEAGANSCLRLLGQLDDVRTKRRTHHAQLVQRRVRLQRRDDEARSQQSMMAKRPRSSTEARVRAAHIKAVVVEGAHHRALGEGAEIATLGRGRAGRILLGSISERDLSSLDQGLDLVGTAVVAHQNVLHAKDQEMRRTERAEGTSLTEPLWTTRIRHVCSR